MQSYNIWYDTTSVWQSISNPGWLNTNYRQITLAKPATGDLLTWLEDNAVRLPLTGTWVWNSGMLPSPSGTLSASGFTSNGNSYTSISFSSDGKSLLYDSTTVATLSSASNLMKYTNEAYRVITFTSPVQYTGNEDFVKWFTANAKPLPAKGKTLNEYTWAEIRQISDANKAEEYGFKPGDTKSITINGTIGNTTVNRTVDAVILGINHNSGKEGNNRIHFLIGKSGDNMCGMTDSNYDIRVSATGWCSMNTSNTNSGGWNNSHMRKTLLGNTGTPTESVENTFLAALPTDLRAEMKSCTKYSDNTGGSSNPSSAVTATTDYLFLLAEWEVFGAKTYASSYEQNSQVQYDYFKAGNSKVAGSWESPATAVSWWLRSVYAGNGAGFCRVLTSGAAGGNGAAYSRGVLPGFCV